MLSPAFTACPTLAAIFRTFPGTEAATLTAPAPAAAFGAAFGAGAAFRTAAGLQLLVQNASCLFNSYFICCSVNGNCITFHFRILLYLSLFTIDFADGTNNESICSGSLSCCNCCCDNRDQFCIVCFCCFHWCCHRCRGEGCCSLRAFSLLPDSG